MWAGSAPPSADLTEKSGLIVRERPERTVNPEDGLALHPLIDEGPPCIPCCRNRITVCSAFPF